MSVVLILGAGGAAGWVFHAGVTQALLDGNGWDARQADLLIGTSAGAAVAAGLRAGVEPQAILASATRPPTAEDRAAYQQLVASRRRTLRPLAPGLIRHLLPGGHGAGVALAGVLPPGWMPTTRLAKMAGVNSHRRWPDNLWIPAFRVPDGQLTVFGRDRLDVPVEDAVRASSAIPGLFQPMQIDGHSYVDGGIASPTHADLAIEISPDLVIISSPMTRPSREPLTIMAKRRLRAELRGLSEAGVSTLVISPPEGASQAFRNFPRRDRSVSGAILEMAWSSTTAGLDSLEPSGRRALQEAARRQSIPLR